VKKKGYSKTEKIQKKSIHTVLLVYRKK